MWILYFSSYKIFNSYLSTFSIFFCCTLNLVLKLIKFIFKDLSMHKTNLFSERKQNGRVGSSKYLPLRPTET